MLNKVEYWLDLCDEDIITVNCLLNGNRLLPAAYFCHQITEKALKAVVSSVSKEIPPRTHDLTRLAKLGGIDKQLTDEQKLFLNNIARYQIEARYPEHKAEIAKFLTAEKCKQYLIETEDFLCWIKKLLDR
ncbi:MAG: HEPN domain-containing protein [Oscillospiraceae bacterium]|nr:HEPN domain-containing protein [Oscillospiraceae bacterium]